MVLALAGPSGATGAREIGPDAPLCVEINRLAPGEELLLGPGEYQGPCTIRRGGRPGAPIVVRARDPRQKPRIVWQGRSSNVFDVKADYVTLRDLRIGPTQEDVDGVRIFAARGITVEGCEFTNLGGIAVVANHFDVRGLTVRGNVVMGSRATAMYFGCHDGTWCTVLDLVVEDNSIHGVSAPAGEVGYGIQVKLNSAGMIRGNVVVDTKGPGIMVYGAHDPGALSVVERNVVAGSRGSSGIVLGGGPAIVRNNVSVRNSEGGIALEDYRRRGLLRGIVIAHNTVHGNAAGGILAPQNGVRDTRLLNNAVEASGGRPALPPPQPGILQAGNVNCALLFCWADPQGLNFSPAPGSALLGAGVAGLSEWLPREDFFGAPRAARPVAGAIERPAGPLLLDHRPPD